MKHSFRTSTSVTASPRGEQPTVNIGTYTSESYQARAAPGTDS